MRPCYTLVKHDPFFKKKKRTDRIQIFFFFFFIINQDKIVHLLYSEVRLQCYFLLSQSFCLRNKWFAPLQKAEKTLK